MDYLNSKIGNPKSQNSGNFSPNLAEVIFTIEDFYYISILVTAIENTVIDIPHSLCPCFPENLKNVKIIAITFTFQENIPMLSQVTPTLPR